MLTSGDMSLYIASLNSGSNGNCYYIGNEKEAVMIDAGLSCRETERRMLRMGLSLKKVKAIFISHEHSDHIKGVTVLSKKHSIPVYITPQTLSYSRLKLDTSLVYHFDIASPVLVNDLKITAFTKHHDAADPHSFIVEGNSTTVGIFTDIGIACDNLSHYFGQCHAAFLEANYDSTLLENGRYPIYLKNRIRGGKGHLSNDQALALFKATNSQKLTHIFLSHLSKDNNCPDLAAGLFRQHAGSTEVIVASRFVETGVYHIRNTEIASYKPGMAMAYAQQASLF